MRLTRVFHDGALSIGDSIELSRDNARHLGTVLRLKQGQEIILFNGQGGEYRGNIAEAYKGRMTVNIREYHDVSRESALNVTLVQGIAKTQRMDYSLQKSVELGVHQIQPVLTERGNTPLKASVIDKKQAHWLGIIVSAAEQSGRTRVPALLETRSLEEYLHNASTDALKLVLDPQADTSFLDIQHGNRPVHILVGPEGGLSFEEIERAEHLGFQGVRMGPRILRTETASSAALGILQALWGDMSAS
jgi:16S rRNA (uracil1498-N3)-methyltransferase